LPTEIDFIAGVSVSLLPADFDSKLFVYTGSLPNGGGVNLRLDEIHVALSYYPVCAVKFY